MPKVKIQHRSSDNRFFIEHDGAVLTSHDITDLIGKYEKLYGFATYEYPLTPDPTVKIPVKMARPIQSPAQSYGARVTDPDTSQAAAALVNTEKRESEVRDAVWALGTATNYEIAIRMNEPQIASISPRIKPLRQKGLLRYTGHKRRGGTNRMMRVWECVPGTQHLDPAYCEKTVQVDDED